MQPKLHYYSLGEGQPLIILHGLFGSSDNWAGIARRLAPFRRVICVDLPNHGRSAHTDEMSYASMARDVAKFMDDLCLPAADLLGHSMGGKTAMEFAQSYPGRVNRLVIVDIAPRAYAPRHEGILAALNTLDPSAFGSRSELEQALLPAIPDLEVVRFLLKNLQRDVQGGFYWGIGLQEISRNYPRVNEAIHCRGSFAGPVLVIRGEKSDYVNAGDVAGIRTCFPEARQAVIPQAGHWVHAEAPGPFTELVNAFLSEGKIS